MKIYSFIKRLNATELGLAGTHDAFIFLPREIDLSSMLQNQVVVYPFDRVTGKNYSPTRSDFKYVQTGQNNQERVSGLGEYYERNKAKVGDEILIEVVLDKDERKYYIDFCHRKAIVFQVNSISGKRFVEILENDYINGFANNQDYKIPVIYREKSQELVVKFIEETKKKITSPKATKFYDLLIDGKSIVSDYSYQEYIEILTDDMRLDRMKTFKYSIVEIGEDYNE